MTVRELIEMLENAVRNNPEIADDEICVSPDSGFCQYGYNISGLEFDKGIRTFFYGDDDYPCVLLQCDHQCGAVWERSELFDDDEEEEEEEDM